MGRANVLAYIALLLWLPISFIGVSVVRPTLACAALMLGAVMFLPNHAVFDLPGMPPIDKTTMASFGLLLACLVRYPAQLARAGPGRGLELMVLALVIGGVGTVLTNRDTLVYGTTILPRLALYDSLSTGIRDVIRYAIPFFLGRAFYRRPSDLKDLLIVLTGAGLIYSLFILYELRMAPTLHRDIFGTFSHRFTGAVRWGGYRPTVFMASSLALALFVVTTVVASGTLARARVAVFGLSPRLVTAYLFVILVLCKSVASVAYALFGAPLVWFTRARFQARVATLLAVLVFAYPMLRSLDLVPTSAMIAAAAEFSPDRADSLDFRFENEDRLAAKARQRPVFGWGGFRRARAFDESTGDDLSITDGAWIIFLGERGYIGFGALFGLMLIPVLQAGRAQARVANERDRLLLSGAALIVALSAVDLLPNGLFTNSIFFVSGCLSGSARGAPPRPPGGTRRPTSGRSDEPSRRGVDVSAGAVG